MQAYRYNWPTIVIMGLQTNNIIPVLYDKVIIIAKNFERTSDRLTTSDFQLQTLNFWCLILDFGFRLGQLKDFRLWFQTQILDFGHLLDFRLWFLDSRF